MEKIGIILEEIRQQYLIENGEELVFEKNDSLVVAYKNVIVVLETDENDEFNIDVFPIGMKINKVILEEIYN